MDQELLHFIKTVIHSVWTLETLLFMREHGYRAWSRQELARELRSNPILTGRALSDLTAAGLLSGEEARFAYAPASQELEELTGRLAAVYVERPVAVVNAIVQGRTEFLQIWPTHSR